MEIKENPENIEDVETPDNWWYRVYFAVMVTTVIVILALWFFSKYFSV